MAELLHLDQVSSAYYGQVWVGHKITPDADWLVESVWHARFFALVADGCYCYIYADGGDEPTGSVLATSDVVNGMATTSAGAPATFTFSTPYLMTSGVSYWFVWHVPAQQCFFWYGGGNHYPGGSLGYSTHASQPIGNWIVNGTLQASAMKVNGSIYIPNVKNISKAIMSGIILGASPAENGGGNGGLGEHFDDNSIDPLWTISVQGGGAVTEPVGTEIVVASSTFSGYLTGGVTSVCNGCYRNIPISGDFDKTVVVTATLLGGTEETAFVAEVDNDEYVYIDPYTNLVRCHHHFPGSTGSDQDAWDQQYPIYLRIARVSGIFYSYWSQNGTDWTELIPGGLGRLNNAGDVTIWLHAAGLFSSFDAYFDWYGDTTDIPDDW